MKAREPASQDWPLMAGFRAAATRIIGVPKPPALGDEWELGWRLGLKARGKIDETAEPKGESE